MTIYPDETSADALEAWSEGRREADMEMAELIRAGRDNDRLAAMGYCLHGSAMGYVDPPVYPEQKALKPGQVLCTAGCDTLYETEGQWIAATGAPGRHPVKVKQVKPDQVTQ